MSDKFKVVQGGFGAKPASDLARILRELADKADSGEVVDLVYACVNGGQYELGFSASMTDSLVLSSLLQNSAIDKFKTF